MLRQGNDDYIRNWSFSKSRLVLTFIVYIYMCVLHSFCRPPYYTPSLVLIKSFPADMCFERIKFDKLFSCFVRIGGKSTRFGVVVFHCDYRLCRMNVHNNILRENIITVVQSHDNTRVYRLTERGISHIHINDTIDWYEIYKIVILLIFPLYSRIAGIRIFFIIVQLLIIDHTFLYIKKKNEFREKLSKHLLINFLNNFSPTESM